MYDSTTRPGHAVHVRYTKWGDRAHWEYDQVVLGEDEHGVWSGGPEGTPMSRPGAAFDASADFVSCFSRTSGWVATFWSYFGERAAAAIYVDITTVPVWSGYETPCLQVTMVDLDLDVIRRFDGELFVDDEDEFAEHQLRFGYPADIVSAAEATGRAVYLAMEQMEEPFGSVGSRWLADSEQLRVRSATDGGVAPVQKTPAAGQ